MNSIKFLFSSKLSTVQKCLNLFCRAHSQESFLTGTSSQYIEDMYNAWLKDPTSVHVSWDSYFRNTVAGHPQPYHPPPSTYAPQKSTPGQVATVPDDRMIEDHLVVQAVIRSYQSRGHLIAKLDPLELVPVPSASSIYEGSSPSEILRIYKGENLDKIYTLPQNTFIGGNDKKLPLREIMSRLEKAYGHHIGVEFMYIDNFEERQFIREKMEAPDAIHHSVHERRRTLKRLIETFEFENFLAKKWASEKRFGVEGCDMFVPMLAQIIDKSTVHGVEHFFIGIAHRGRLNMLANIFNKPLYQIFNQFVPLDPADYGSGDVKYHYGSHIERTNSATQKIYKLTLLANPSHLECVNALVLGRTRAEQFQKGDDQGRKSLSILIHGDAAFSGQGINYENLGLSYLPNYTTHGNICIVINNQVGFTTDPRFSRSSRYCTDLGHVVNAPIFHVNADDPDSVIHVANIAAEWRSKFHKDVVIDLVGYRKHGHNEADEPMFTQPLMYTKIKQMKPAVEKYGNKLIKENVVTPQEIKDVQTEYNKHCEEQFVKATQQKQVFIKDWLDSPWTGFYEGKDPLKVVPTGVPETTLRHIGEKFSSPPPENLEFVIHPGLLKMLSTRQEMIKKREIDWSLAEALAIGSLLKEGIHVRISGEDVERGTFSNRHHVLHHQTMDRVTYEPLNHLFPNQARYVVCNSSLSEYGVLGFELGYAQANPNTLVMWEAQFGDFFNVAQCIFDQFISSGESKWGRQNGLVCSLPHGYEGMGAEHSSSRVERFLMMCDDDSEVIPPDSPKFAIKQLHDCNWIVANCSSPANFFHILRRQILLPFRKPLIHFGPKSLLRLRACRSSLDEMIEGTEFQRVIPEKGEASKDPQNVKKLIFCSGKAYYDIAESRKAKNLEKVIAIARVEQLSPFPYDLVKKECEKYPKAKLWWAQEEPKNMGSYDYVKPRMNTLLKGSRMVNYVGRPSAAAPATGTKMHHINEVKKLAVDYVAL